MSYATVTSAETAWAVDTSVAVAALDQSHEFHAVCRAAVLAHRPALAGHAAFETFSVLTQGFPEHCWLDARRQTALLARLGEMGLAGGSVYDALVASAAMAHGRRLLSRDQRAERTYQLVGVDYEWVGPR